MQRPPNESKLNLHSYSSSWFSTRNSNNNASRPALSTKFQDRQDRIKTPSQNQNNHMNHVSAITDWVAGLNMDKFLPVILKRFVISIFFTILMRIFWGVLRPPFSFEGQWAAGAVRPSPASTRVQGPMMIRVHCWP